MSFHPTRELLTYDYSPDGLSLDRMHQIKDLKFLYLASPDFCPRVIFFLLLLSKHFGFATAIEKRYKSFGRYYKY